MAVLIDVFKSMRRGKKAIPSCPQCGGLVRRSRAPLEGWILPVRYVCEKCGYSGFLTMEEESGRSASSE
jgi:predicted RNA-binding Zn-ribbon protein involved in translation (DUF1610 family)